MDSPIAAVFYFSMIGWCLDSHPFQLVSGYTDSKFLCVTNDTPNFSLKCHNCIFGTFQFFYQLSGTPIIPYFLQCSGRSPEC